MDSSFPSPQSILDELRASPEGKGAAGRAEVAKLAPHSAARALGVARAIGHPWYKCQALTSVVEHNPSLASAQAVIDEAFDAAYSQSEPNRVAVASFWPLRVQVRLSASLARAHVERLISVLQAEPHGLRRLDGLAAVVNAVVSRPELRSLVLPGFLATAARCEGWRTERILANVALAFAPHSSQEALQVLAQRPASRFTKRALEQVQRTVLANGGT